MYPSLKTINNVGREELTNFWQKNHGVPAPKGISQGLLKLSAAYHLQARRSHGRVAHIDKALLRKSSAPKVTMEPGSLLVRQWHGRSYKVEALDQGFLMNGQTFKSLSQIAKHITGTKWSGPRFFGLRVEGATS